MEIIKGNYGKCFIGDCLDEEFGLTTLKQEQFDLAFLDPPFNIDLKYNINCGKKYYKTTSERKRKTYYEDCLSENEYKELCIEWFQLCQVKARKIVLYCGSDTKNLKMWFNISKPLDMIIYFLPFNTIITPSAWAGRYRPLLIYARDKNDFLGRNGTYKFNTSVIEQKTREDKSEWDHPCPIDMFLLYQIFEQLKPHSVLDPFLGSGTTAQICEELGIKWRGYEIDEKGRYKEIIKRRINKGIHAHKFFEKNKSQTSVLDFIKN